MGRWKKVDGSVTHKQTLFVSVTKKTTGAILIKKDGTVHDNTQVVVETIFTDWRNRVVDVTAPEAVMKDMMKNPENYGHDNHNKTIRRKHDVDGVSPGYLSHIAAEYNFGAVNLPTRYHVRTKDGDRMNVTAKNQIICKVGA